MNKRRDRIVWWKDPSVWGGIGLVTALIYVVWKG